MISRICGVPSSSNSKSSASITRYTLLREQRSSCSNRTTSGLAQMLEHRTGQGLDLCLSITCNQHAWLLTSPMHDVFKVTDAFEATRLFTMEIVAQM